MYCRLRILYEIFKLAMLYMAYNSSLQTGVLVPPRAREIILQGM
jgi:hypothetical protein